MDKTKKTAIAVLALLLLGFIFLWKYIGTPLLSFISDPAAFQSWVDARGVYGRLAFIGMMIFQIIISIIPGGPFQLAAGYAFGALEGSVLCIIATSLGGLLTFGLVRRFGMKVVRIFFSEEKIASVRFLKSSPRRDLWFAIIYVIPGSPKDLLGYFAGITDMRFPFFLFIATVGRLPSIVTSAVVGSDLQTGDYHRAAIVFAVMMAVSCLGLLLFNRIQKRHKGGQN